MFSRRAVVTPLLVLPLLASCDLSSATGGATSVAPTLERTQRAPVHRVTGGGKLDVSAFSLPPETYGFTASVDADGAVRGQFQAHLSDPEVAFHAEVTCLVVQGHDAWLGFVVTHTDDPSAMSVGAERWLRVQDNGEGASAEPDRMGFLLPGGGAARCNERRPVALPFVWLHGDIRVD